MSKEEVIEKTLAALKKMPVEKGAEVADFAEFMLTKLEDGNLQKGMEMIMEESKAFDFLRDEEDIYSVDDLIEKY